MTAAELLEKSENWCQGTNAKDKEGRPLTQKMKVHISFILVVL